jgi:hypothetical protein
VATAVKALCVLVLCVLAYVPATGASAAVGSCHVARQGVVFGFGGTSVTTAVCDNFAADWHGTTVSAPASPVWCAWSAPNKGKVISVQSWDERKAKAACATLAKELHRSNYTWVRSK